MTGNPTFFLEGFIIFLGIILGLFSALAWGTGDFIAKRAVDKIGHFLTLFYMFLIGTILLGLMSLLPLSGPFSFDLPLLVLNLIASLLGVLGYFFLYYGFEIGSLSVVSTITAAGTIVPVGLSLLILKEWPTSLQFLGIGSIIVGVVLVSIKNKETPVFASPARGVVPALLSAVFFGSYVIMIKILSVKAGPVFPLVIVRGMGAVVMGAILFFRKETLSPPGDVWRYLFMIGVLDALALLSFTIGINKALVAIVAPLSSLFTLVTVGLAHLILKEKLLPHQKLGFWIVIGGVLILSF